MSINKITSFLGICMIVAASYSVFILEKVNWWDALAGVVGGTTLIYTKNNNATEKIVEIFKYKQK